MDKDNKSTELDNTDKKLHISGVIKRTRYIFDEVSKSGSLTREKPISTYANSIEEAEIWFRNNYNGWIYQILEWNVEYV